MYDLGLTYKLDVDAAGHVDLSVTLTSLGCPLADTLLKNIRGNARNVTSVARVPTALVWEPP